MAAATVDIPAIALSVGPMLNGRHDGVRTGSGTIVWEARQMLARGEIDYKGFIELVASSAPSTGYCNTMGTATTMNSLTEALGMQLPGGAAIPAPYRDRAQWAWETGRRIVEMVRADRRPSAIMTRAAFLNAIKVNSAIGGSTNAPIHLNAIARHMGVALDLGDWQKEGGDVPLLVNMQPAGEYLGEDYYHAGGVPAVIGELYRAGLLDGDALGANGRTLAENYASAETRDERVIRRLADPLRLSAGLTVLSGNLFDSAIMKTSVISDAFRAAYLSNPDDPEAFEGTAIVFDGPEDYHARIDDPALGVDRDSILVIRGAGPVGYPGGAEVVNMRPPVYLIRAGIDALPCIGDGRQSGTSGSPSILNASPEAAVGGGLALVRSGDRIRVDLGKGTVNLLVDEAELVARRAAWAAAGGADGPPSQTPWQEIHRNLVGQFDGGSVFESAVKYQRVAATHGIPRDSH
jgi:dihydroxy-acid dehydratase